MDMGYFVILSKAHFSVLTTLHVRAMGSRNKYVLLFLLLLSFSESVETKDLCRFERMFPTRGKDQCVNDEVTNKNNVTVQYSTSVPCPPNMMYGNCTCGGSCKDPMSLDGCYSNCTEDEGCMCPEGFLMKEENCVPQNECKCFLPEASRVLSINESFISSDCSRRSNCTYYGLVQEIYGCSPDAVCEERNNTFQCYCKDGFTGDGQQCTLWKDCSDVFSSGFTLSGIYTISPRNWSESPFEVYCNMSNGGEWTVFQRRVNGTVDFYRIWEDYKKGFGSLDHEFWLGNDKIHSLTDQAEYELRIDLVNKFGWSYYVTYSSFRIGNEDSQYILIDLGHYNGFAGYDAMYRVKGYKFSTLDNDNDNLNKHCAQVHHGGWWFRACGRCNLNGGYFHYGTESIWWGSLHGNETNIVYTEMKIRATT